MRHLDEHLDDGIIHALLDGELRGDELAAARAHVLACESCSARLAEERVLAGEAERLIAELDEPAVTGFGEGGPEPPGSPVVKGPPVVLIPERPEETPTRWQRRRKPARGLGIAAMIAVAAGAGFFAMQGSPAGTFGADSVVSDMPALPPADERALPLTDSAAAPSAGDTALVRSPATLSGESAESDARDLAAAAREEAPAAVPPITGRSEPSEAPTAPEVVSGKARDDLATRPRESVRQAAAERAPAQRDEAAPTVATRSVREAPVSPGVVPARSAPARSPAPPSLEQQAQISMRIGLDEAQRLLGSPMHVIDGMQPEFVGLVPGRLVRGANPSDYVVRVVYLDDRRRMIFLDQQRLDLTGRQMGEQRDTIPPEWVKGDVRISLSGDISSEAARALARRVR